MPTIRTQAPEPWDRERVEHPPLLVAPDGRRITTVSEWESQRSAIEADWREYLGNPPFPSFPLDVRTERTDDYDTHQGTLIGLKTEPDYWEQCYLMTPKPMPQEKLPAVVVFFYDVDTPSGHNMGSRIWREGNETRQFARHLVERGYVTLAQRWVYEGKVSHYRPGASNKERYLDAVAGEAKAAPGWKGLGRVVWDASRCVDYLTSLDFVDPNRIGCMGHSLGGKMAFYASAFDRRFRTAVSSDFGIGLSFSNWDDPWYLGPEVTSPDFGRDHHQLLAMMAPRPFLLIAGEETDGDRSWPYLNAAQDVYRLYGAEDRVGMYNHGTGHAPTMDACEAAYTWFDKHL